MNYKSATDESQGSPNLEAIQLLQEQLPADVLSELTYTCKVTIATGGDAGVEADIPVGAEIIGATVVCTKTNGGGMMVVKTGGTVPSEITDEIACATDKAVNYAAEIDDDYNVVTVDGVKVFTRGADDAGNIYIYYRK